MNQLEMDSHTSTGKPISKSAEFNHFSSIMIYETAIYQKLSEIYGKTAKENLKIEILTKNNFFDSKKYVSSFVLFSLKCLKKCKMIQIKYCMERLPSDRLLLMLMYFVKLEQIKTIFHF